MNCSLSDSVHVAFNSFQAGLVDKDAAVDLVLEAICNNCADCKEDVITLNELLLDTLERAVDDEMENLMRYPLDEITIEQAELFHFDDYVVCCEDGHVTGLYRQAV